MTLKVSIPHWRLSTLWPFDRDTTIALGLMVAFWLGVLVGMLGQVITTAGGQ